MCGITGAFSITGVSSSAANAANNRLLHRGPDAEGLYTDENQLVLLAHRRLSILDLSEDANQPMHSSSGRYIIVYNGEVYNFRELKNKLPGFNWKTSGDSEVILELFAAFGPESFPWLKGIFALAIYDSEEHKLFLLRDQAGIKPLFYYQDDLKFVFASELKAIKAYIEAESESLKINKDAIPLFLHLGFIPEPDTIYQNTYKFPAANYGIISKGNPTLELTRFWNAADHFLKEPIYSEEIALRKYQGLLFDAVGSQMVSDVPLGTFLSGGIDSSLVTAVASKLSDRKINTFSIGFQEAAYDESGYAAEVAKHLQTDHHSFKVSADDVLNLVPLLLDVYDEPFADSSAFPTMLVSQLAGQHVTVALSGDGGDELFQGYGMYTWANRLAQPLVRLSRKPLYYASSFMPDRYRRAGKVLNYPSEAHIHSHIFSQEQYYFGEQELSDLLIEPKFSFAAINQLSTGSTHASPAEKQAFWDFEHYLKDDLLVKVDRAGMHYSLETRVPLLDTGLVEFALNLDYNMKVREGYGSKYLMKKVLYDLVPRELFERPKRGFAIPLKEWLKGPLAWMVEKYLDEQVLARHGMVHPGKVTALITRFNSGYDHLYNRIWTLLVLHWWLEENS